MSATPLPTLTPEDQTRLALYFASDEDAASIPPIGEGPGTRARPSSSGQNTSAQNTPPLTDTPSLPSTSPDLLSAYAFLSRPEIAAWVAFHREQVSRRLRHAIIAALESALTNAKDLVEIRRASSTILRALASPHSTPNHNALHRSLKPIATASPVSSPPSTPFPPSSPAPSRPPNPNPRAGVAALHPPSGTAPQRPTPPAQPSRTNLATSAAIPAIPPPAAQRRPQFERLSQILTCCGRAQPLQSHTPSTPPTSLATPLDWRSQITPPARASPDLLPTQI